jgi:hypothetical protein
LAEGGRKGSPNDSQMKYVVRLRKTIVQETVVEVEYDGPITKAMDVAEAMELQAATTTEGKWKVVSINNKKEES